MCFPGIFDIFVLPGLHLLLTVAEGAISSRYARATTDNRSNPHIYDTNDAQGSP